VGDKDHAAAEVNSDLDRLMPLMLNQVSQAAQGD
jgi:hypothetical protein